IETGLRLEWRDGKEEIVTGEDPLVLLNDFMTQYELEYQNELPAYQGGPIGMISYDYVRRYETLPVLAKDDLVTPDVFFYLFDESAVLDIENEKVYFMALPEKQHSLDDIVNEWTEASQIGLTNRQFTPGQATDVDVTEDNLQVSVTGEQFEQMVRD